MKLLSKLAVLVVLMAFASSCQKEDLPSPGNCPMHKDSVNQSQNQRLKNRLDAGSDNSTIRGGNGDDSTGDDEIVGGGDDDRDGGGNGKKSNTGG